MTAKFNYARSQAVAKRLLDRFGAAAILRKVSPAAGATDPWTPDPTLIPTDQLISAVLVNYTDIERTNELIAQGDRKVIFAALGLPAYPVIGDTIIIGLDKTGAPLPNARAFTIINLDTVEPGAVAIVFIAQVRI